MLALRWVAIGVNEQILVAVVRGLERRARVDPDQPSGRNLDPLGRLTDVQRERPGKDDKRLLLRRMAVSPSFRSRLVAPDIAANVREAGAVAQLGDVPRWLAELVGACEPLELVWTNDAIPHRASLSTLAWASFRNDP